MAEIMVTDWIGRSEVLVRLNEMRRSDVDVAA